MTRPRARSDAELVEILEAATRTLNSVVLRWVLLEDVPLLSAAVMLTLHPDETPVGAKDVAAATRLSEAQAIEALHELAARGYASEQDGRYVATDEGRRAHGVLTGARREALLGIVSALSEQERASISRLTAVGR